MPDSSPETASDRSLSKIRWTRRPPSRGVCTVPERMMYAPNACVSLVDLQGPTAVWVHSRVHGLSHIHSSWSSRRALLANCPRPLLRPATYSSACCLPAASAHLPTRGTMRRWVQLQYPRCRRWQQQPTCVLLAARADVYSGNIGTRLFGTPVSLDLSCCRRSSGQAPLLAAAWLHWQDLVNEWVGRRSASSCCVATQHEHPWVPHAGDNRP